MQVAAHCKQKDDENRLISRPVKASESVGHTYEKLKSLMPTMEAVACWWWP